MQTMSQRVIGALALNKATYQEVEQDPAALGQAAVVVGVAALLSGIIGGAVGSGGFMTGLLGHLVSTFVGWFVLAGAVYFVGVKAFAAETDIAEMLRVTGFAYAPALFFAIPCVGVLVFFWLLATCFVAVREALDLDNAETIATIVLALIGVVVVKALILVPLGLMSSLLGGLF